VHFANITGVINSKKDNLGGHVERKGEMGNSYNILVGNLKCKDHSET